MYGTRAVRGAHARTPSTYLMLASSLLILFSSSSLALAFLRSEMNCTSPRMLALLLDRPKKPDPALFDILSGQLGSPPNSTMPSETATALSGRQDADGWLVGVGGQPCRRGLEAGGVVTAGRVVESEGHRFFRDSFKARAFSCPPALGEMGQSKADVVGSIDRTIFESRSGTRKETTTGMGRCGGCWRQGPTVCAAETGQEVAAFVIWGSWTGTLAPPFLSYCGRGIGDDGRDSWSLAVSLQRMTDDEARGEKWTVLARGAEGRTVLTLEEKQLGGRLGTSNQPKVAKRARIVHCCSASKKSVQHQKLPAVNKSPCRTIIDCPTAQLDGTDSYLCNYVRASMVPLF
jgi:hypothetical protein